MLRALMVLAGLVVGASAALPNYNTNPLPADKKGMTSTATQVVAKMKHGINIGNTLEATGGETNWGNPKITQAYVDFIKASGFDSVRLPASFNQYADATTAKIDPTWLARVKEVVNYCVKNDLYVFINIHWDGGWLEEHCTPDKKDENNAKQKAYWQQIATTLRDFDEHVMFASANEPNVDSAEKMEVLMTYHQTFVDTVRATGGKNAYRNLVIQGPNTDFEKTYNLMKGMPTDTVANKLIAEVHYYTPWNFCGLEEDASWGKMFYYWGQPNHSPTDTSRNPTWGEESDLNKFFGYMKTKFVDNGIPVFVGEFSSMDRKNKLTGDDLKLHEASRAYWTKSVTAKAKEIGNMVTFYWDTGSLLDRTNLKVLDQPILNALMGGSTPANTTAPTTPKPTKTTKSPKPTKPTKKPTPTPKPTKKPKKTTKPPKTTETPAADADSTQPAEGARLYGRCGGSGWTGPTTCAEGTCVKANEWYSQCQ